MLPGDFVRTTSRNIGRCSCSRSAIAAMQGEGDSYLSAAIGHDWVCPILRSVGAMSSRRRRNPSRKKRHSCCCFRRRRRAGWLHSETSGIAPPSRPRRLKATAGLRSHSPARCQPSEKPLPFDCVCAVQMQSAPRTTPGAVFAGIEAICGERMHDESFCLEVDAARRASAGIGCGGYIDWDRRCCFRQMQAGRSGRHRDRSLFRVRHRHECAR